MPTVFVNGRVFDPVQGSKPATVAVQSGRIVHVGSMQDARRSVAGQAVEVDLAGGLLSPSFTDAHLHPMTGGIEQTLCNLTPANSAQECLDLVAEYSAANPQSAWITGGGWQMDHFPGGNPSRQALDKIEADRPVVLRSTDRHSIWVNTKALEMVNLNASIPDPVGGRIEREPSGFPSGVLHETAISLVEDAAPDHSTDDYYQGLMFAQEHCLSLGITGWQDAMVLINGSGVDMLDAYEQALERKTLKAKVTAALRWDMARGTEQIDDLCARRSTMQRWHPRFDANSVKIILDGIVESFTAALTQPYRDTCGHPTSNSGINFYSKDQLLTAVQGLDAAGFQIHMHALGDKAVRDALDALASLRTHDRRHHLAHLQVVQEADIQRFSRLGVTANIQPLWAQNEPQMLELTIPFLPTSLAERQYPFEDLRLAGTHLAAGSDWPVSSADPIEGIHVAVNRSTPETSDHGPFIPNQGLKLVHAWQAYTRGSAEVNHRDQLTGSLGEGLNADLVVLDRDPFTGPSELIGETKVVSTWVDGELVWHRPS